MSISAIVLHTMSISAIVLHTMSISKQARCCTYAQAIHMRRLGCYHDSWTDHRPQARTCQKTFRHLRGKRAEATSQGSVNKCTQWEEHAGSERRMHAVRGARRQWEENAYAVRMQWECMQWECSENACSENACSERSTQAVRGECICSENAVRMHMQWECSENACSENAVRMHAVRMHAVRMHAVRGARRQEARACRNWNLSMITCSTIPVAALAGVNQAGVPPGILLATLTSMHARICTP